jgi:hypothetical protein
MEAKRKYSSGELKTDHTEPSVLYIANVPPNVKNQLAAIAINEGQDLSNMLKPHLRKIIESYPPELRTVKQGLRE